MSQLWGQCAYFARRFDYCKPGGAAVEYHHDRGNGASDVLIYKLLWRVLEYKPGTLFGLRGAFGGDVHGALHAIQHERQSGPVGRSSTGVTIKSLSGPKPVATV